MVDRDGDKMSTDNGSYERTGIKYDPSIVFSYVSEKLIPSRRSRDRVRISFNGDLVNVNSWRLITFKVKGLKCAQCGIEGKYFVKERSNGEIKSQFYHFNLYAIDSEGMEVLMTKDHIVPRSKGGKNHISNLQTMCFICNEKKGNASK
jgi:HNH endonuclease